MLRLAGGLSVPGAHCCGPGGTWDPAGTGPIGPGLSPSRLLGSVPQQMRLVGMNVSGWLQSFFSLLAVPVEQVLV